MAHQPQSRWHAHRLAERSLEGLATEVYVQLRQLDAVMNSAVVYDDAAVTLTLPFRLAHPSTHAVLVEFNESGQASFGSLLPGTTTGLYLASPAQGTGVTPPTGIILVNTLTAGANGQTLRGALLAPIFAAGGFTGLTAVGLDIADVNLAGATNIALRTGLGTVDFSAVGFVAQTTLISLNNTVEVATTAPYVVLRETDAAADNRRWAFSVSGASFAFNVETDAVVAQNIVVVTRSGGAVTELRLLPTAGTVTVGADPGGTALVRIGGSARITGPLGVNVAPTTTVGHYFNAAATGSGVVGPHVVLVSGTATAGANDQELRALSLQPVFAANSKTNLTYVGLHVADITGGDNENFAIKTGAGHVLHADEHRVELGTITAQKYVRHDKVTWNQGGTTFYGWQLDITDTASADGWPIYIQVGTVGVFQLNKIGSFRFQGSGQLVGEFKAATGSNAVILIMDSGSTSSNANLEFAQANSSKWGFECFSGTDFRILRLVTGNIVMAFDGSDNVGFFGVPSAGGGDDVIFIKNATTVPSSNPTGGGILYAEGGALKWRGSGGTVTTIAAA